MPIVHWRPSATIRVARELPSRSREGCREQIMQTELNLSSDKRETKMEEQFTAHVTRNDTPIQRTNLPVDHTVSVSQCELGPDAQHGYADHSSRNDEVVYSASEPVKTEPATNVSTAGEQGTESFQLPNTPYDPEEDSAKWNSLLEWARQQRGPQWDAGTGVYVCICYLTYQSWQVPRGSAQYYNFVPPEY